MKVIFRMTEFSSRKIITHCFHVENVQDDAGIGYGMIIGRDLMVKLGLKVEFGRQILEWYKTVIHTKQIEHFLGNGPR